MRGRTTYSDEIPGSRGNYDWPVRFDFTDGFVGISQYDKSGELKGRVLLSPKQVKELIALIT